MNKSFRTVVQYYLPKKPELSHQHTVMRLYRRALRTIFDWSESRDIFNEKASEVRAEFNANMNLPPDSAKTARFIADAEARLQQHAHPDPYIACYMPGGTLFMRNPAIPIEAIYPDGVPPGVSTRRLNIDMSDVPEGQEYANQVFVDSATKKYWIDK